VSSYWSLSFWFSHQNPIWIPLLPHACYMLCPSHPLDLVILIIHVLGELYKLWSSSICSFMNNTYTHIINHKPYFVIDINIRLWGIPHKINQHKLKEEVRFYIY
jgi:hypothetical protein